MKRILSFFLICFSLMHSAEHIFFNYSFVDGVLNAAATSDDQPILYTLDNLYNFPDKDQIRVLVFTGNDISRVKADHFEGYYNLTSLDLVDNLIDDIESGAFDPVPGLTHLYINNNDYEDLPVGLFDPLTNLQVLYLSESLNEEAVQRIKNEVLAVSPQCEIFIRDFEWDQDDDQADNNLQPQQEPEQNQEPNSLWSNIFPLYDSFMPQSEQD